MTSILRLLACAALAGLAAPALAALNVFATVPEWGALAEELGGDKVKIYVATNALQDPHHVEAKPSLIARARSADLVVATGAELEIGWLPLVMQQAGNPKSSRASPATSRRLRIVPLLEKPTRLDRADGDVHPGGQSAHPDRSAQHRARRRAARGAARGARSAQRRLLPGALQGIRGALDRGDRQLGEAGGAAEGRVHRRAAQGVHLPRGVARSARRSPRSSPSPASSRRPRILSEVLALAAAATGEDGHPRGLPERSRVAMDRRAREDQRRRAAVHGRRSRWRKGPLRPVRRHDRAAAKGAQ